MGFKEIIMNINSILSTLMPVKSKGKGHVFPAAIYEEPANFQDDVMPFEPCEFAQYFLHKVPDLLSSKHSLEFKYAYLVKKYVKRIIMIRLGVSIN